MVNLGVNVVGIGRTFPNNWEGMFSEPKKVSRLVGDVSNHKTAANALKECLDKFGGIDILVNNAGVVVATDILNLNMEDWDKVMDTNLKGLVYFSRTVALIGCR